MISKYAGSSEMGDLVFTEMDRVLREDFGDMAVAPSVVKTAGLTNVSAANTALSELTGELIKVAEKLELVNHPAVSKVDEVLSFISKEILSK